MNPELSFNFSEEQFYLNKYYFRYQNVLQVP